MEKQKIIYAFDPLCGWCFGFHDVISRLKDEFSEDFDFDIKSGGLVIGSRICKISEKARYLKKSIPDVERITGIQFGEAFMELLEKGEYISNSIPPSIAFNVFKSFRPDIAFEIAHTIQKLHYVEGMDLNNIRPYFRVAEKFGVNKFGFMERYEDPMFARFTEEEFDLVKSWGAHHYPAILVEKNNEFELVSEGFIDFETLKEDFQDILQEHQ